MENRQEVIEKKALEMSEELSKWAKKELHLASDECFTVTLRIEKTVIVAEAPRENILVMPILDFFRPQRCKDIVGDKSLYTKIKNRLTEKSVFHKKDINLKTVGDLVTFGRSRLFDVQYFGKATVRKIE